MKDSLFKITLVNSVTLLYAVRLTNSSVCSLSPILGHIFIVLIMNQISTTETKKDDLLEVDVVKEEKLALEFENFEKFSSLAKALFKITGSAMHD